MTGYILCNNLKTTTLSKSLHLTETVLTQILQITKLHTLESKKKTEISLKTLNINFIDWEISIYSQNVFIIIKYIETTLLLISQIKT